MPYLPLLLQSASMKRAEHAGAKNEWALTQRTFSAFLEWLDSGQGSPGESYVEMRARLVAYFDRKNCVAPDDLADETLNRVARRLEEEGQITDASPPHYCYITAKFVFLEYLRRTERAQVSLDELTTSGVSLKTATVDDAAVKERRLACLDHCLSQLDDGSRRLITEYYQGERRAKIDSRRRLAESLGITANALNIRACRIRDRLERCAAGCLNRN
jgi:DNA-directed RNA polymerase specialized sigma24 family protein